MCGHEETLGDSLFVLDWTSMGCWRPVECSSPLPSLEGNTDVLNDYPSVRADVVGRCAVAAYAASQSVFAVQRHGQCHQVNEQDVMRDYRKLTGQCSVESLTDGSYEIFNITAVNTSTQHIYQTIVDGNSEQPCCSKYLIPVRFC